MGLFDLLIEPLSNNQYTKLFNNAQQYADSVYAYSQSIWDREDSAYQRMVQDMQKAGLNPWTGVSSGGSQTSNINPAMDRLNALIGTFDNYLGYANNIRQWFGTGSDIMNDTARTINKFAETIGKISLGVVY